MCQRPRLSPFGTTTVWTPDEASAVSGVKRTAAARGIVFVGPSAKAILAMGHKAIQTAISGRSIASDTGLKR